MPVRETKFIRFALAVAAQVAVIIAVVFVLAGEREVLLKIASVDPRDWRRGDYVTLGYDISNVDTHRAVVPQIKNGEVVYVVLQKTGKYWTAVAVQKAKPKWNEVFVKGKVVSGGVEDQAEMFSGQLLGRFNIVYGIERFFAPEDRGVSFDFRDKEVAALVMVDDDGSAFLKRIYVGGEVWPRQ